MLEYSNTLSPENYNRLRAAVGWEPLCMEQAESGIKNSAWYICAVDGDKAVAAARIIWDGGYIAYLADVMVQPEYQHMGIGQVMVERAQSFLRAQLRPGWRIKIVLVSTKGNEKFYMKLGFRERPNADNGPGMDMWIM